MNQTGCCSHFLEEGIRRILRCLPPFDGFRGSVQSLSRKRDALWQRSGSDMAHTVGAEPEFPWVYLRIGSSSGSMGMVSVLARLLANVRCTMFADMRFHPAVRRLQREQIAESHTASKIPVPATSSSSAISPSGARWAGVLIKVAGCRAIDRADIAQSMGAAIRRRRARPKALGMEVSGEIVEVGAGRDGFSCRRQSQCALVPGGGYAEYLRCIIGLPASRSCRCRPRRCRRSAGSSFHRVDQSYGFHAPASQARVFSFMADRAAHRHGRDQLCAVRGHTVFATADNKDDNATPAKSSAPSGRSIIATKILSP